MISYESAISKVLDVVLEPTSEKVELLHSLNRVLAKDVIADINMPPFDKSAMDGYACRRADLHQPLEVIEVIPAGVFPEKTIAQLQCAKIMTGAPIPLGADCVIKVEETSPCGENRISFTGSKTNNNISYQAEDITKGQVVVPKGIAIQPRHIAMMASMGYTHPEVYIKPRACVFSTGNELVEPEVLPINSQIRNGNASQIISQLQQIGISANYGGIISDDEETSERKILEVMNTSDIIILSGGVSMGDFDFIPSVLKKIGFNCVFDSIAVQPGKPTTFWNMNNKWCFGLPGNPISSLVQTELLVKPFIFKFMGCRQPSLPSFQMPIKTDFSIPKRDRKSLVPVSFEADGTVLPISYHGSAHISAMVNAQGLMIVDEHTTYIPKESLVHVRLI